MRLLYFIEEHYLIGLAAYGLRELSAFLVSDISRRRSDQTRYGVLLLILAHVDTRHHVLVVKEVFGQRLGEFCLADTSGAQEDERADRTLGVVEAGTAAAHCVGDGCDGFVLTHDAAVELFFEVEQFLLLALHHLVDGDSGPARHYVGYVLGIHFFLDEGLLALHGAELLLNLGDFLAFLLDARIADFGHTAIVAFALGLVGLEVELLYVNLVLLYAGYELALGLPLGGVGVLFLAQFGYLALNLLYPFLLALALHGLALDFLLRYAARDVVESLRHGVNLKFEFGGSLVDKVDGLVRQEAVSDVALRELYGGDNRLVADTYLVVVLVALLQSAEDGDGGVLVGLVDHHFLESAFERLVFLEVFLILVERGGADAAEFAARQCRLEDVGGVHGAFALACSDESVDFVDEEDNLAFGRGHFVDDGLQTFLEFALVLGTGHEGAHIERVYLLAAQVLGHVTADDTLRESFGDGRLARTGFADKHGIVLRASAKYLEHAANLLVTSDDRVELARPRTFVEVHGVLRQRVVCIFGTLVGRGLALAELLDGGKHLLAVEAGILEDGRCGRTDFEYGQKYGLECHVLVAEFLRLVD